MAQVGKGYLEDLLTRLRSTASPHPSAVIANSPRGSATATAVQDPPSLAAAATAVSLLEAECQDDAAGSAFWRQLQSQATERWLGESALDGVLPTRPVNIHPSFFAARAQTPK